MYWYLFWEAGWTIAPPITLLWLRVCCLLKLVAWVLTTRQGNLFGYLSSNHQQIETAPFSHTCEAQTQRRLAILFIHLSLYVQLWNYFKPIYYYYYYYYFNISIIDKLASKNLPVKLFHKLILRILIYGPL